MSNVYKIQDKDARCELLVSIEYVPTSFYKLENCNS